MRQRRYSKEEFARRADEIYDKTVRPAIEAENLGKFVAINVESGAIEIGATEAVAAEGLRARVPDAQVWLQRVGSRSLYHFGFRQQSMT